MGVEAVGTGARPDRGTRKETAALRKEIAPRQAANRAKVTNDVDALPNIDRRSAVARRFSDVVTMVVRDQGGLDLLAEVRLQLIRRFSACCVLAERMEATLASGGTIDLQEHALLCSTMARLGSRIGLDRTARDISPTLGDLLRVERQHIEGRSS